MIAIVFDIIMHPEEHPEEHPNLTPGGGRNGPQGNLPDKKPALLDPTTSATTGIYHALSFTHIRKICLSQKYCIYNTGNHTSDPAIASEDREKPKEKPITGI